MELQFIAILNCSSILIALIVSLHDLILYKDQRITCLISLNTLDDKRQNILILNTTRNFVIALKVEKTECRQIYRCSKRIINPSNLSSLG